MQDSNVLKSNVFFSFPAYHPDCETLGDFNFSAAQDFTDCQNILINTPWLQTLRDPDGFQNLAFNNPASSAQEKNQSSAETSAKSS